MERSALRKFHEVLQARRDRLGQWLSRHEKEQGELDRVDSQAEMIDIAQSLEQIGRNASIQEQELRELEAIDYALSKISSSGFGVCEHCEEEIPMKRLLAVPEARLCTRCQAVREREQSRVRSIS